ncbi:MAG: hypothetical protein A3I63_01660 [Betaproteobacteria bacterium RIFCSPLOWO2_02_FULL_66_14]|nr:MAG: hypothetical protein A3I63_01660 [Betaproteobacteria bacterium RIFCSPLOWO2_02_FULL_66_14]
MIPRVIEVRPLENYRLWLRFQDGVTGTIDLSAELWGPVFEPLRDVALFRQAAVHPDLETVAWPNGADFAPEFLYQGARRCDATEVAR